jgi:hypothetical protein
MAQESALDILKKYQGQAGGQQRDTATINAQLRSRAGLPEQSSFIGDVLLRQMLGQGVLMGAGDEAEAYARSVARGTKYEDELSAIRQQMSVTRAERPISSTAAEIVGGFVPAAALTAVARLYDPIGFVAGRPFRAPDPRAAARYYRDAVQKGDAAAQAPRAALKTWLEEQARAGNGTAETALKEFWP